MSDGTIAEIPCRYCDGGGREPRLIDIETRAVTEFYQTKECPVCSGRGMLRVSFPDTPTNCGPCRGTGRIPFSGSIVSQQCYTCRGIGLLSLTGSVYKYTRGH